MKKRLIVLLLVIFCLSLCACENVEKICEECKGSQNIDCSECNGNGMVICPEEDCERGITGTSCSNCGGREEINECYNCDGSGEHIRICENCGGYGEVVNEVTFEKHECGECNSLGQVAYTCDTCEGYGLICTYCKNDVTSNYHPYYKECETCLGNGKIECGTCKGAKKIPCYIC